VFQLLLRLPAARQGLHDFTAQVAAAVADSGVHSGMCNLFVRHTSASLTIQENADPDVQRDLQAFLQRLVPEGDPIYRHIDEGPDDMPAHVRSALTATSLNIPVVDGRLALGTWQGVYLWEHRRRARGRSVVLSIWGNGAS